MIGGTGLITQYSVSHIMKPKRCVHGEYGVVCDPLTSHTVFTSSVVQGR
jgi:hypothetical protein